MNTKSERVMMNKIEYKKTIHKFILFVNNDIMSVTTVKEQDSNCISIFFIRTVFL